MPVDCHQPGPASYFTVEQGAMVLDRFGARIGPLERVLIGPGTHFDGIIVRTPIGRRFVDAPEVRRFERDRVHLTIAQSDVEYPGEPRVLGAHVARQGRTEATEDDRRAVIDALKYAYVEDDLTTDDLAERVGRAYEARTLDDLEHLLPPR